MIEVSNVFVSFFTSTSRIDVLKDFNFTVAKGEFLALVGPSGCGKSTILNLIAGFIKPLQGKVLVFGQDIYKLSENELADYRLYKLGFIFQEYYLFPGLTAIQNVAVPLKLAGVKSKEAEKKSFELLQLFDLADRGGHLPAELSGGEQQRLAIARALTNNPEIILVDEPTGNLDEENSKVVLDILIRLHASGKTIILVTHDHSMTHGANRVLKLRKI